MEKTVLVGFGIKGDPSGSNSSSLEELKRLVETAGGSVCGTVLQRRPRKDPATLVGKGKAGEIARWAANGRMDAVIFDEDLTPAQQKNLQEIIPAKVIDRTRLILDIFAQRARTREGKLQVELAQLNYLLPRITEKFGRFEQQTGGAGKTGGIGTRGPGERKLEVDKRRVRDRIARLKRDIERVRGQRALHRENRERVPLPVTAIVGYTNAGKSTLLNSLHREDNHPVYADDKLFATLDPTARRVTLPSGRTALFVDTVGFIQKLPHDLVAAFHATLEEVNEADLLVHVADAASPEWKSQVRVVQEVIKGLGAGRVPQLTVFNKADLLTPAQRAQCAAAGRLVVSAKLGWGVPELLAAAEKHLDASLVEKEFVLPHRLRRLLDIVYKTGRVLHQEPAPAGVRYKIRIDPKNWGRIRKELSASP